MPSADEYREMAVQDYQTAGEISIGKWPPIVERNEGAPVAVTDGGAWVSAWVYVADERFAVGEDDSADGN